MRHSVSYPSSHRILFFSGFLSMRNINLDESNMPQISSHGLQMSPNSELQLVPHSNFISDWREQRFWNVYSTTWPYNTSHPSLQGCHASYSYLLMWLWWSPQAQGSIYIPKSSPILNPDSTLVWALLNILWNPGTPPKVFNHICWTCPMVFDNLETRILHFLW